MSDGFDRLVADATAYIRAGRRSDAAKMFRAALAVRPGHAGVLHNLGIIAAQAGDQAAALQCFDEALAAEPRYAAAHFHRAVTLHALGRREQAISALTRTIALDAGHYEAHRALALALLAEGRRGPALDHFARTYELRRGEDRSDIAVRSLTHSNRVKLLHDAAQFRYLASRKRDSQRFEILAKSYAAVASARGEGTLPLTDAERGLIGESYNTAIHSADAPEIPGGAVADRSDRNQILAQFRERGAAQFDGLLTSQAFDVFGRYLLESAIWHDFSHIDGFVAAYLEDGLACPLLLQIAEEIRAAFPELLDAHPLSQAWAFKAVMPTAAVDVHVDDAAVSLNFWMTPDQANLDPSRGGMRVCLTPPPVDWPIDSYDSDKARALQFLEQNAHSTLVVPYKANRAVLFRSRLVHSSDAPNFADSYGDHRINVTLLFGGGRPGQK